MMADALGQIHPFVILYALFSFRVVDKDKYVDREMYGKAARAIEGDEFLKNKGMSGVGSFDFALNAIKGNAYGSDDFVFEQNGDDFVIFRSGYYKSLFKIEVRCGVRYFREARPKHPLYSTLYAYDGSQQNREPPYKVICDIVREMGNIQSLNERDSVDSPREREAVNFLAGRNLADGGDGDFLGEREAVNSPSHYNFGGIECIDAMKASMSMEGFRGFNKGSVMKYLWRQGEKEIADELEDANKALWYLIEMMSTYDGGMERVKKTIRSQLKRHEEG